MTILSTLMGKRSIPLTRFDGLEIEAYTVILLTRYNADVDSNLGYPFELTDGIQQLRRLSTGILSANYRDGTLKTVHIDPGFTDLTGYSLQDLFGQDLSPLLPSNLNDRQHTQLVLNGFKDAEVDDNSIFVIFVSANTLPRLVEYPDKDKNYQVFVSYNRRASSDLAGRVVRFLLDRSISVWFDKNDIPFGANFKSELQKGIVSADKFVFFLTNNYCDTSRTVNYCLTELEIAIELGKPILPIIQGENTAELTDKINRLFPQLKYVNWFEFRPSQDDPKVAFSKLISFIENDAVFYSQSRHYLQKALVWEAGGRHKTELLKNGQSNLAYVWLEANRKTGAVAPLVSDYIQRSSARQVARRRLPYYLMATFGFGCLAVVMVMLNLLSRSQFAYDQLEESKVLAQINGLLAQSTYARSEVDQNPCKAIGNAVEAVRTTEKLIDALKLTNDNPEDERNLSISQDRLQYMKENLSVVVTGSSNAQYRDDLYELATARLHQASLNNCEVPSND